MSAGPAVRLLANANPRELLGFVVLAGEPEVRVRFRRSDRSGVQWRCDAHGAHRFSTCPHEVAVRARWQAERHVTTNPGGPDAA